MTTSDRIVVVGASLAGLRAAEALRREGHHGPLTLIGAETHLPYERPPLSKQLLTGRADADATALRIGEDLEPVWRLGTAAASLDLEGRRITLADGDLVDFDRLVVATGAGARRIPGLDDRPGTHLLRTLDDAVALRAELTPGRRLVILGAGFIGLEVASSAVALGLSVTVVETASTPLGRAVDPEVGRIVAAWHRAHGVDLRLSTTVEAWHGEDPVDGVVVTDTAGASEVLPADVVVVGVGAAPATAWLEGSGVDLDDGVRTDSRLRVLSEGRALAHVVAAGDVARRDDPATGETVRVEHWTNATDQGAAAAAALQHGDAAPVHEPVPYVWSDQYDRKIQLVGQIRPDDEAALVDGDVAEHRFVMAYGRAGRLVGAIGFSRAARVMALGRAVAEGAAWPL